MLSTGNVYIPIYGNIILCLQYKEVRVQLSCSIEGEYVVHVRTMLSTGKVCYSTNYISIYGSTIVCLQGSESSAVLFN